MSETTPETSDLREKLADRIGEMPEAQNVFDIADEAITWINALVEAIADALLPVVAQEMAAAEQRGREAALREAAVEIERVERIGLTPADEITPDEREWFNAHHLRNVDGYQRHRPVVATWLRDRAAALAEPAAEEGP